MKIVKREQRNQNSSEIAQKEKIHDNHVQQKEFDEA